MRATMAVLPTTTAVSSIKQQSAAGTGGPGRGGRPAAVVRPGGAEGGAWLVAVWHANKEPGPVKHAGQKASSRQGPWVAPTWVALVCRHLCDALHQAPQESHIRVVLLVRQLHRDRLWQWRAAEGAGEGGGEASH